MTLVLVRLLVARVGPVGPGPAGSIRELPAADAERLVAAGKAELYIVPVVESAMLAAPEQAARTTPAEPFASVGPRAQKEKQARPVTKAKGRRPSKRKGAPDRSD